MPLANAICRNVTINGRRTSLRLEASTWEALEEIAARERVILNVLCSRVEAQFGGHGTVNLSSALRDYVLKYFREAATEDGHHKAGHGVGAIFAVGESMDRKSRSRGTRRRSVSEMRPGLP